MESATVFEDVKDPSYRLEPSREFVSQACHILDMERVTVLGVCEEGILWGIVLCPDTFNEISCSIMIKSQYDFYLCGEIHSEVFSLALLLKYIKIKSSKKSKRIFKKLVLDAPEWIKENPPFFLDFPAQDDLADDAIFENIQSLEAYWTMLEMAINIEKKANISAEILVQHIFKLYGDASAPVLRAAMEAIVIRFQSAQIEGLVVAVKPEQRAVFGFYQVRAKRQELRPYKILLAGNHGLEGSCSCKDYQHNTLRWCKHLSAVYIFWHRGRNIKKKFFREIAKKCPRIKWIPSINMKGESSAIEGLEIQNIENKVKSKLILQLQEYFLSDGKLDVSKIKDLKDKSRFLNLLKKCSRYFKNECLLIDPAIVPLVARTLEQLVWPEIYRENKKQLLSCMDSLKFELYSYQRKGIERALEQGRFLIADEMGLGKTVQAIGFSEALMKGNYVKKILLICPAALKSQWKREWGLVSEREITVVSGPAHMRRQLYSKKHEVLAINYELLLRDLEEIQALNFDLIILDEAQRIKNFATETARRVKTLQPFFRLILTGTPMENRIAELSSLLDWIKPAALGPYWRLNSELAYHNPDDPHLKGVQNLNAVRKRIASSFIRRTRKEVLTELPSRSDCPIYLPITEEQKIVHEDFSAIVGRLMAISEARPLSPNEHIRLMANLTKMRIVSNGIAQLYFEDHWDEIKDKQSPEKYFNSLFMPKLREFRNLIEGLISQKEVKIVIFSQWQRMLRLCHWAVQDVLSMNEIEAVFFTGKESQVKRTENIGRFHDDSKVRLFFATDAGGVGLNLQRAANICINLELPWNPAVLEQRVGRIYRIGQEAPIQIFNLVMRDCIEERISALVEQKKAVFNALFEGESDEICFDKKSGFYEQVKEALTEAPLLVEEEDSGKIDMGPTHVSADDETSDDVPADTLPETLPETLLSGKTNELNDILPSNSESIDKNLKNEERHKQSPEMQMTPTELLKGVKLEMSDGVLKIEAKEESAKMMASMFKMMGQLFETSSAE